MSETSKPPLIHYRPDQQIVRKQKQASIRAGYFCRQPEAAYRGAIWGFVASIMAVMILILMMVEWPEAFLGVYGFGAMLCLPFCGIAGGSFIAQWLDRWERRSIRGIVKFWLVAFILAAVGFGLPMAFGVNVFQLPVAYTLITLGVLIAAAIVSQR